MINLFSSLYHIFLFYFRIIQKELGRNTLLFCHHVYHISLHTELDFPCFFKLIQQLIHVAVAVYISVETNIFCLFIHVEDINILPFTQTRQNIFQSFIPDVQPTAFPINILRHVNFFCLEYIIFLIQHGLMV